MSMGREHFDAIQSLFFSIGFVTFLVILGRAFVSMADKMEIVDGYLHFMKVGVAYTVEEFVEAVYQDTGITFEYVICYSFLERKVREGKVVKSHGSRTRKGGHKLVETYSKTAR